jgi:4-hydroxy-4-methyl-2-oxoglutarate aldolase
MPTLVICLLFLLLSAIRSEAQHVVWPSERVADLTAEWSGERTPDGRPHVSAALLERLKGLSMEEVWGSLRRKGYTHQFENFAGTQQNGWEILHPDQVMTGRALTAQFMPLRPDFNAYVQRQAESEGTKTPVTNYAPIIKLMDGDIYVADSYGKIVDGTLIGDNLGNAIYAASKRGVVFNGSVRDVEGLSEIDGFNFWIRGSDPSAIRDMMVATINAPIRIGRATVLPGDVILAKSTGVAFIPPHLVQEVVIRGEYIALRDAYNFFCIKTGKYEYVNEAFVVDAEIFEKDFRTWLAEKADLPMPRSELDAYLEQLDQEKTNR